MDYTMWERVPNIYNGSDRKVTLMSQGKQYLVKFPDPTRQKKNELSYVNNVFSEYIGSQIFAMSGIPAQKTELGTYQVSGVSKVVCVCEDFTDEDTVLIEFNNLAISNITSDRPITTAISDIMKTLQESFPEEFYEEVKARFWDIFVIDALIGNTDRHNGNWGFLYHKDTKKLSLAPVYDCGSALDSNVSDEVLKRTLQDETEFKNRATNVYSCLRADGKRINYSQFFQNSTDRNFLDAVCRRVPLVSMEKIGELIKSIDYISDVRKEFYCKFLSYRFEKILRPTYMRQIRDKS